MMQPIRRRKTRARSRRSRIGGSVFYTSICTRKCARASTSLSFTRLVETMSKIGNARSVPSVLFSGQNAKKLLIADKKNEKQKSAVLKIL